MKKRSKFIVVNTFDPNKRVKVVLGSFKTKKEAETFMFGYTKGVFDEKLGEGS